ncbi:MAG: DUF2232 domain-containing protein [Magnetococcales bacterium]|nr:DUF2232 domain-containing protein [Magnetococcales bacterium]
MLLQKLTGNPLLAGTLAALLLILPLSQIYLLFPLQLIVPLPIYLIALRQGNREGLLAAGVPVLFCLGLLGQIALPLVLTYVVMIFFPLLAAWLLRGGWRPIQVLGGGFFLSVIFLVLFLLWSAFTGNAFLDGIHSQLMVSKQEILTSMSATSQFDAKLIVEMEQNLNEAFKLFALLFPAMFLSSWFTIQVGNLLLVRYVVKRWQMPLIAEQDLSSLRIPFFLVWPLIAFGLLAFLTTGSMQRFGINLVLFLAIPYFFQGYSVVQKLFLHYKVSVFTRAIFYMMLITWTALILAVTVLGLFDTWVDFRSRLTTGADNTP